MSMPKTSRKDPSPAMPAWKPASAEAVAQFDRIVAQLAGAERRKMFGYPCAFVNGNMVAGVFGDQLFLRLALQDRESFLKLEGAVQLEPMPGRPMREYLVIPRWLARQEGELAAWVDKAAAYGVSLPPKLKPEKQTRH